jgi:hypothetical protein
MPGGKFPAQLMKLGKRRLVCAIIIATAAAFCAWWIIDRSKPGPEVFQNFRSNAEGTVSFTLTNPTTISYYYWVLNEFKTNEIWNLYPSIQITHWEDRKELPPQQAVTISVSRPNRSGKWRVIARCVRSPSSPPTLTTRIGNFLNDWNLSWVVTQLKIYDNGVLVPGPEMP